MEIVGVGVDIIDIRRIEHHVSNQHFLNKIFTQYEQELIKDKDNCAKFIAKRWAAKEACFKALGKAINWRDIEITNLASGQPILTISGYKAFLSLSDEPPYAIAYVMLTKETGRL